MTLTGDMPTCTIKLSSALHRAEYCISFSSAVLGVMSCTSFRDLSVSIGLKNIICSPESKV